MRTRLVCPSCRNPLEVASTCAFCNACRAQYPINNGIYYLEPSDSYWGEVGQETMEQILDEAQQEGWQSAVASASDTMAFALDEYAIGEGRADGRFLLPINEQSTILDVGAGWGSLAFELCEVAQEVVALEAVPQRAQFMDIRRREDDISQLQIVVANALSLPFCPDQFDVIILNGMLEWIGLFNTEVAPVECQRLLLSRAYELLKKNGSLYIGIENRYGYQYFLGERDHSGLRYTSLMPRWLADIYIALAFRLGRKTATCTPDGQTKYRTLTHSYTGYQQLLHSIGFNHVKIWGAIPCYRFPHVLVPLWPRDPIYKHILLSHLGRGKTWRKRLRYVLARAAVNMNVHRHFFPYFVIIARKESDTDDRGS